ncbi:MAG: DUF6561 domain-containing protein [Candidatus Nitrosotenuis sp.]
MTNNQILISQIEEITSELGEPDCKLTYPYLVKDNPIATQQKILEPFLFGVTKQNTFMISSDKILTLADPTPTLLEKYEDLIKE